MDVGYILVHNSRNLLCTIRRAAHRGPQLFPLENVFHIHSSSQFSNLFHYETPSFVHRPNFEDLYNVHVVVTEIVVWWIFTQDVTPAHAVES